MLRDVKKGTERGYRSTSHCSVMELSEQLIDAKATGLQAGEVGGTYLCDRSRRWSWGSMQLH